MNILGNSTSFFWAECLSLWNSALVVLRKSQLWRTPDTIPSLHREIIKSADEIGFGGAF